MTKSDCCVQFGLTTFVTRQRALEAGFDYKRELQTFSKHDIMMIHYDTFECNIISYLMNSQTQWQSDHGPDYRDCENHEAKVNGS